MEPVKPTLEWWKIILLSIALLTTWYFGQYSAGFLAPLLYIGIFVSYQVCKYITAWRLHEADVQRVQKVSTASLNTTELKELTRRLNEGHRDLVNSVISNCWPFVASYLEKCVLDVMSDISYVVPSLVSLGGSVPVVENLTLLPTKQLDRLRLVVDFNWRSQMKVKLSLKLLSIPVGLENFHFNGSICMQLGPLINRPPFFEVLQLYFRRPPEFNFCTTGIGSLIELPGVRSQMLTLVKQNIQDYMVFPNIVNLPLTDKPDEALLFPLPSAVVRVVVHEAFELPKEGSSYVDPYVMVNIGPFRGYTDMHYDDPNPVWNESFLFVLYDDSDDQLHFTVWDFEKGMFGKADMRTRSDSSGDVKIACGMVDLAELQSKETISRTYGLGDGLGQLRLSAQYFGVLEYVQSTDGHEWDSDAVYVATVYLRQVYRLPSVPDADACLKVMLLARPTGRMQQSRAQPYARPCWNQAVSLVLAESDEELAVQLFGNTGLLGEHVIDCRVLRAAPNMTAAGRFALGEGAAAPHIALCAKLHRLRAPRSAFLRGLSIAADSVAHYHCDKLSAVIPLGHLVRAPAPTAAQDGLPLGLVKVFCQDGVGLPKSDPYIMIRYNNEVHKSRRIARTRNPVWNEDIKIPIMSCTSLMIEVYDWDRLTADNLLGRLTLDMNSMREERPQDKAVQVRLVGGGVVNLKISWVGFTDAAGVVQAAVQLRKPYLALVVLVRSGQLDTVDGQCSVDKVQLFMTVTETTQLVNGDSQVTTKSTAVAQAPRMAWNSRHTFVLKQPVDCYAIKFDLVDVKERTKRAVVATLATPSAQLVRDCEREHGERTLSIHGHGNGLVLQLRIKLHLFALDIVDGEPPPLSPAAPGDVFADIADRSSISSMPVPPRRRSSLLSLSSIRKSFRPRKVNESVYE